MASMRARLLGVLAILAVAVLMYNAAFSYSFSSGPNWRNVSVDTTVNITNAAPEILLVTIADPLTLSAGTTAYIECNVSVRDYNGAGDINFTNATFYHNATSNHTAADNNNSHYTNSSCAVSGQSGDFKNFTCGFDVSYYALNGTWVCNATTVDNFTFTDNASNSTTINSLLAVNVTPLIDYGDLSIGDTSANQTANITNIGNVPINISVRGFGGNDESNVSARNLSFICDEGNISIEYQKFSSNITHDYSGKTNLSYAFQSLANVTIPRQNDSSVPAWNLSYWQLYVPPNPFGVCNGTVVFQAEQA